MNSSFQKNRVAIVASIVLAFIAGIAVNEVSSGSHGGLQSSYLGDSSITCTRTCSDGTTIDAEQSCPDYSINTIINTYCGDNSVQSPNTNNQYEQCDDGNMNSGDGCSSECTTEYTTNTSDTPSSYCGDGSTQSPNYSGQDEQCDDGNTTDGDGCTSSCTTESYNSASASRCGDGAVQQPNDAGQYEQCDDGDTDEWNGCNNQCQWSGAITWENTTTEITNDGNNNGTTENNGTNNTEQTNSGTTCPEGCFEKYPGSGCFKVERVEVGRSFWEALRDAILPGDQGGETAIVENLAPEGTGEINIVHGSSVSFGDEAVEFQTVSCN